MIRKNFNPYDNFRNQQQGQQGFYQPQYRMPTMQDFYKLFTKLDLAALILLLIVGILPGANITYIFIKSFATSIIFMPKFILLMTKIQKYGQPIRNDGPQSHLSKKNTPTMGGLFIVFFSVILAMSYCNSRFVYIPIITLISYGVLGFYDDYAKLRKNNSKGITPKKKFIIQTIIAAVLSLLIYNHNPDLTNIYIPFFGLLNITPWLFVPLGTLTIVSTSNAFNLTDGLDSLAITQYFIIAIAFILVALGLTHHSVFINSMFYNQEVAKFLLVTLGVGASFFWFNSFPAKIFMGDVGSLALGAVIGVVALLFAMPLVLIIVGAMLVAEALSVIIQVYYFRKTQKRIFLMAPIHHHFEKLGYHENQITQAILVVSVICGIVGLSI